MHPFNIEKNLLNEALNYEACRLYKSELSRGEQNCKQIPVKIEIIKGNENFKFSFSTMSAAMNGNGELIWNPASRYEANTISGTYQILAPCRIGL